MLIIERTISASLKCSEPIQGSESHYSSINRLLDNSVTCSAFQLTGTGLTKHRYLSPADSLPR